MRLGLLVFAILFSPLIAQGDDVPSRIEVYPQKVTLSARRAVCQLVVTGYFANGTRDLTREATFTASEAIIEFRDGMAVPKNDGKCELVVTVGKLSVKVPVEVS